MPRRGRRVLLAAGAAMLGAAAFGAAAWAGHAPLIIATDNSYSPPPPVILEGDLLFLDNNGMNNSHSVTADDGGPGGGPLFDSGIVPAGAPERAVNGTQFLEAGDYGFHCRIHPSQMQGTLQVDPSPSGPVERPEISLKVKSKKLEKVVDSEKLKVEVTSEGPTDAEGISLKGRKGKKGVTKQKSLDLAAGDRKTTKLKLKDKAVEKLSDLDRAKLKVEGTVEFGFGDKAKRKLK